MDEGACCQLAAAANALSTCLHNPVHGFGYCDWIVMLPHSGDSPTSLLEQCNGFRVTFTRPRELGLPPCGVGLRCGAMFRAGVPETAINEHSHMCSEEDDISPTRQGPQRSDVHPVPQTQPVKLAAQRELRWGVPLAHIAHAPADHGRGGAWRWISREHLVPRFQTDKGHVDFSFTGLSANTGASSASRSDTLTISRPRTSTKLLRRSSGTRRSHGLAGRPRQGMRRVCRDDAHRRRGFHILSRWRRLSCSTGTKAVRAESTRRIHLVSSHRASQGSVRPTGAVVEDSGTRHTHQGGKLPQ